MCIRDSATPTLDAIKEKGTFTLMTATGFPPFEYLGADGQPAGVDIDVGQLVADELGVEYEVLDMDFGLLIEALKSGKGDMIGAGMTVTDERAQQVDFTVTYATAGQVLLLLSLIHIFPFILFIMAEKEASRREASFCFPYTIKRIKMPPARRERIGPEAAGFRKTKDQPFTKAPSFMMTFMLSTAMARMFSRGLPSMTSRSADLPASSCLLYTSPGPGPKGGLSPFL